MNGKTKKPRSHIHTHVCTYNYPYACVQFTYKQQTFKHRHIIIRMYMYICSMHTPLRTSACNTNYTLSVSNQELIIHNQGVYTASLISNQEFLERLRCKQRGCIDSLIMIAYETADGRGCIDSHQELIISLDAQRLYRHREADERGCIHSHQELIIRSSLLLRCVYNSLSASFACSFSCLHLNVKSNVCLCLCLCEYLDRTVSYCHSSQHNTTSHTSLHLFLVKKNTYVYAWTRTLVL